MLNVHCGLPNSAAIGWTGSIDEATPSIRFHQPVRSETKYSAPSGDHSGWKIDSLAPPAIFSREPIEPSALNTATHSSVPSHGMFGWFHCSHARNLPSGLTIGSE